MTRVIIANIISITYILLIYKIIQLITIIVRAKYCKIEENKPIFCSFYQNLLCPSIEMNSIPMNIFYFCLISRVKKFWSKFHAWTSVHLNHEFIERIFTFFHVKILVRDFFESFKCFRWHFFDSVNSCDLFTRISFGITYFSSRFTVWRTVSTALIV